MDASLQPVDMAILRWESVGVLVDASLQPVDMATSRILAARRIFGQPALNTLNTVLFFNAASNYYCYERCCSHTAKRNDASWLPTSLMHNHRCSRGCAHSTCKMRLS